MLAHFFEDLALLNGASARHSRFRNLTYACAGYQRRAADVALVSDGTWTCKVKIGVNLQVDDHDGEFSF